MIKVFDKSISVRIKPANLQEKDEWLFLHEFYKEIRETHLRKLMEAYILEDVIFSLKKVKFFPEYSLLYSPGKKSLLKKLLFLSKKGEILDKGIWVTDNWSLGYFHWLTDTMPRLFASLSYMQNHRIILPEDYREFPFISESLQFLNLGVFYYNVKRPLRVKELLIPSHVAMTGNYNDSIINQVRSWFLKEIHLNPPYRKIFVSRSKALKRKIVNEGEMALLLKDYGFEIHHFEDYNFAKQVELMSETRSIIGLHGAGLTNILFMQSGGQILEIRNKEDNHNNCYFSLASALNIDYYYQICNGNGADTHVVNVEVDLEELKKNLALMDGKWTD
jgi:capsular polysaccharide biosynthesis protein